MTFWIRVIIDMHITFLSLKECAERLGFSYFRALHHVHQGNLKVDRWDGRILVSEANLDAFIAARQAGRFLKSTGRPKKS
jgi:hypothetical protein